MHLEWTDIDAEQITSPILVMGFRCSHSALGERRDPARAASPKVREHPCGRSLSRGTITRQGDTIVGAGERQARRIVSVLEKIGILESESPRGPLRLIFPAALGRGWMRGVFPDKVGDR